MNYRSEMRAKAQKELAKRKAASLRFVNEHFDLTQWVLRIN